MDDECGGMGERGVDERSGISTLTLTLRCSGVRNRGGAERRQERRTILVFPFHASANPVRLLGVSRWASLVWLGSPMIAPSLHAANSALSSPSLPPDHLSSTISWPSFRYTPLCPDSAPSQ